MADLDFGAPSFSLGLDLDLDLDLDFDSAPSTSPPKQSLPKSDEHSSIKSNFPTLEDEDFELQETPDPDPPVLKRLRRRPRTPPPLPISPQKSAQLLNAEDEIEDFSSQEDRAKGEKISFFEKICELGSSLLGFFFYPFRGLNDYFEENPCH